ncbi:MAG: hypothetical protein ACFFAU_01600 [Candidatus Hodarchaeota archaeon]
MTTKKRQRKERVEKLVDKVMAKRELILKSFGINSKLRRNGKY